jgi:hypothetical protein
MSVRLHRPGYDHARKLVDEGEFVADERDAWSEHQPTAAQENEFIRAHGITEFGRWHLGVDDSAPADSKGHYKFPYGDFHKVHRCAVLSAESRAGQYKYTEVQNAAAHLHGMMEALKR